MSLRIYHTSDIHNRRGFAGRVRALRATEPGLLLDCGDALHGSQTVYFAREPIIGELDAAGYDAPAIGNREFHYLFGALRARAKKMHHPLLCANLVDTGGRSLPFARELTLEAGAGSPGDRVRLCALLVGQYREGSGWERVFGWRFLDPVAVAREFAATTAPETVLVVLSHLGLQHDRALAAAVPRIDLILGGHSHDRTPQPELVGDVPIVHAGPYGRFVSRTELERDGSGRPKIARFDLLPLLAPGSR